jgi:peptide-methionine (S)-S-oxide reductase
MTVSAKRAVLAGGHLEKYPDGYTCHFIRPNWTRPHWAEKAESDASGVAAA